MAWREGEKIGPYLLLGQLGQGGMATVYKAQHVELNRLVALKVMHQALQEDPSFITRFQREAQIVSGLEHPHIVPIYDYQQHEGQPYLVMKLIEGETLKSRMNRGALSLDEILEVMTAVGSALTYAHKKGVLHRDIKPSNIVLDKENIPYVTDFGLARIAALGESTISADMLLGTPHYISPEQARGGRNLDSRADIYSLGVVLYELIVGRVPFTGDTPYSIIHDHIYTPLPLPSAANPEIPQAVEAVLLKALAKDPDDRYATADDCINDFRGAVQTSHLTALNPDRASVASVSLARLRDAAQDQQPTPRRVIPAPRAGSTASKMLTAPSARARRFWRTSGLVAFLTLCMASVIVSVSAADTLSQLFREINFEGQSALRPFLREENALPYRVSAQMLLETSPATSPENPVDYLMTAQSAWIEGDATTAAEAIEQGYALTDEDPLYWLAAAQIAYEAAYTNEAIAYALLAYQAAGTNPESLIQVRTIGGEFLFNVVESHTFDPQEVVRSVLSETDTQAFTTASPILLLLTAKQNVQAGRPRIAEGLLERLSTQYEQLPEYQLVLGELYAVQGESERALAAWDSILETENVPTWITEKAELLTETLED
ncbi:MAG: protein kinase [bacterium]|nr:protein kinase [bacterium]